MKKIFSKIVLLILVSLILSSLSPNVFAQAEAQEREAIESAVEEVLSRECQTDSDCESGARCINYVCSTSLKEETFEVGKWLRLPGNEQQTEYMEEESPITSFILSIINFATQIIGSIAVILLIVAGFMMIFSQGNQQRIDQAKDMVKYAVIGLFVAFFSFLLITFVQSLFNTA